MNKNQYNFSNMFWEDPDYSIEDGIPKYYDCCEDGEIMNMHHLNDLEIKEFMKMKMRENPEVMKDIRHKKLLRILKLEKYTNIKNRVEY